MTGTAFGVDVYAAQLDAQAALNETPRALDAATHADDRALAELVADSLLNLSYKTWGFGDSVAFEALIAASDHLGDERWARFAHGWGRAWATRALPYVRLDCTAPGVALVTLATRYHDEQLLSATRGLADYLMARPRLAGVYETWQESPLLAPYGGQVLSAHEDSLLKNPPPGVFLDCLHFDPPFLVCLGLATGEPEYVAAGLEQALGYVTLLQQDDDLFDHFVLRGEPGSFGPGWGRGQGWAALGLLDVIETLTAANHDDERLAVLERAVARQIEAMVRLQRVDGHWYTVVTDPASGDESSTAAFMASAFSRALALGIVSSDAVREASMRARKAVLGSLDDRGQLREVSAAVYASTEPSHYAHVPRGYVVPWGQGPALLALLSTVPGTNAGENHEAFA